MQVKICGVTNLEDARQAVDAGADALGFNFWPDGKRYVDPAVVGEIVKDLPPFVTCVGVVVNASFEDANRILDVAHLDILQLHGDELPEFCARFDRPIIRALRVGDAFGEQDIVPYQEAGVRTFLLDAAKPGHYGGTGETFDWTAVETAKSFGRVILAGGLTPKNVAEAVRTASPYAVDTASGVEREPGIKDSDKVSAFIQQAKQASTES